MSVVETKKKTPIDTMGLITYLNKNRYVMRTTAEDPTPQRRKYLGTSEQNELCFSIPDSEHKATISLNHSKVDFTDEGFKVYYGKNFWVHYAYVKI